MRRRLVAASAIAVLVTAALLTGSEARSSAAAVRTSQRTLPAGLAVAIHARLGAGRIRSSLAPFPTINPWLGYSVAVSADRTTALVGAPLAHGGKGAAYVFHTADAGSWSSTGIPTATLTAKKGSFVTALSGIGVALSADGMTAFVGSPESFSGATIGAVSVFHAPAEDAWASSPKPTAILKATGYSEMGYSVAVSPDGTTLVAGAPRANGSAGEAEVFHVASEGAWASTSTPSAVLSNAAQSSEDTYTGYAVAISGDGTTVLVSNDDGGSAYLYHASAADSWASSSTPTAILTDATDSADDDFGRFLALSADGTVALVSAPPNTSHSNGRVDVFHSSTAAAWATTSTPTATLTKAGAPGDDFFGSSVALSADGTVALVGAGGVNKRHGAAYIYRASGEGAWTSSSAPDVTLTHAAGRRNDLLGLGIALSPDGATALVGAVGVDHMTGAADVFHAADASSWATTSTPNAVLTVKALAACVVPKLKKRPLEYAKYELALARCGLGKVTKVDSKMKKGRVVSQSKRPGRHLAIGAKINVKIAK
ncbi:MAG TPA: PASTA domain-containing protein [Gaiellaceae bacterium]|jgi:hypothetical protein